MNAGAVVKILTATVTLIGTVVKIIDEANEN